MPKQRPTIKMNQSGSRRRGGGSLEEPAGTETGQNLANLMGSIVKESTTGKRYTGNVSQRAWDDHGKARAAHTRKTGDIPSDKQVPPPKGEFKYVEKGTEGQFNHEAADKIMPQAERQKWAAAGLPNPPQRSGTNPVGYVEEGTHGQNWDLIRLGMDAREQERKKQERSNGSRGHFDSGHT